MIPIESKVQKSSNRPYTRGITPKHVTSGGADLCACATQFPTPKKKQKKTSQQRRASHTDSDVFNRYAKRSVKGKFEFEISLALHYHQSY